VEHRQKSRLTSQDSIARRVAKVSLDEAKWRRHQVSRPVVHKTTRLMLEKYH
jgi:hypothetical protein